MLASTASSWSPSTIIATAIASPCGVRRVGPRSAARSGCRSKRRHREGLRTPEPLREMEVESEERRRGDGSRRKLLRSQTRGGKDQKVDHVPQSTLATSANLLAFTQAEHALCYGRLPIACSVLPAWRRSASPTSFGPLPPCHDGVQQLSLCTLLRPT